MQINHYLLFLLVLLPLSACSNQAFQQYSLTQKPSPLPEIVISTPTIGNADTTPTLTLAPASTSQILPTQTLSIVDFEELPNLRDVIISSEDFEFFKNNDSLRYFKLIHIADVTDELGTSCLWDCIKYFYSLEYSTLTIMLLRAGDHQKAQIILENLRNDFLKSPLSFEYTASDIPSMPPGSWAMVTDSRIKGHLTGAASITHGSVVVLVTYNRVGSDDAMDWAIYPVEFLNVQIKKLETAGYPK